MARAARGAEAVPGDGGPSHRFRRSPRRWAERAVLALLALLVLVGCARPPPEQRDTFPPDITLRGVTVRDYRGSELRVLATMSQVELYRACGTPGDLRALDASITLPGEGAQLFAPVVTGNAFTAHLEGSGGVRYLGKDGTRASAPAATFDRALGAAGQAFSDAGVRIDNPRVELEAAGFVLDVADERAVFERAVTRTK